LTSCLKTELTRYTTVGRTETIARSFCWKVIKKTSLFIRPLSHSC